MITKAQYLTAQKRAMEYFERVQNYMIIKPKNIEEIEVADFGLDNLEVEGLELLVYVNTERVCAKELVLFERQTCPEHYHPDINGELGKEETFMCRYGNVFLYVPGEPTPNMKARIPVDKAEFYTVRHEIILLPGDQYTLQPNTKHWFQAGPGGAVVSEFSTRSRDEYDIFTNPDIKRKTEIK